MTRVLTIRASTVFIFLYLSINALVFKYQALPYLEGNNETRWAADSLDYIDYFNYGGLDQQLIQLGQNLFGPLVLLWVANGDSSVIYLANVLIFLTAWVVIVKHVDIDRKVLFLTLALNPLLFFSILAVNKEVVSFLVIALYAVYIFKGKINYLLLALIVALFVRWQNILILFLFEFARFSTYAFRIRRITFLFLVVLTLSFIYPFLHASIGGVTTEMVDERQSETSFGLLEVANGIQANYGYFAVLIPKVFANWFGNLPRAFGAYLTPWAYDLTDPYSTFGITGHQLAMLGIFGFLVYRKKFLLNNDLVFFAIFYTIVYSLGAFVQYRYYFPVYLIFCIVAAQKCVNKQHSRRLAFVRHPVN